MRLSQSLIFIMIACVTSALQAQDLRAWLGRKDLAVQAAVRALVVATIASGKAEEGRCLHEQYFGLVSWAHCRRSAVAARLRT